MKYVMYASFLLAAVFAITQVFFVGLTIDTDTFMHYALRMWKYGGLYERWIEPNSPLNLFIYAPIAALALHMNIPVAIPLHAFAAFMSVISILSIHFALKAHQLDDNARRVWLIASTCLLLIAHCTFGVFADREHLLFVFALPWMIQMLLRQRPFAYTCILAGIGFCMKPYDVIIFILLTLFGGPSGLSITRRIFSASSLIIGGINIFYIAIIYLFFPAYLLAVLPLSSIVYFSLHLPLMYKVGKGEFYVLLTVVMLAQCFKSWRDALVWHAFLFAMIAVYLLNAGNNYTRYLLAVPLVMALFLPWLRYYEGSISKGRTGFGIACSGVLLAFLLYANAYTLKEDVLATIQPEHRSSHYMRLNPGLDSEIRQSAGKQFIWISSTAPNNIIEPLGGEPEAVFAYDILWPFPWLYAHAGHPKYAFAFNALTDPLVTALKENPSATLIVDISPKKDNAPNDFDFIGFFRKNPRVDEVLSLYKQTATIENCTPLQHLCRFAVWKRIASSTDK